MGNGKNMTNRPDKFPEWALIPTTDPIYGTLNVVEPPNTMKQVGWSPAEQAPNNWMNWLHYYCNWWIQYLDENLNKPIAYLNAAKPSAGTSGAGMLIYISDLSAGGTIAFSDGTNWRRVSNNNIIT